AHLALCSVPVFAVCRNFCNTTPSNTSTTTAFQAAVTCHQPVVGLRLRYGYPTLPFFSHILWAPRQTTCQFGPLGRGQAFLRFKARQADKFFGELKHGVAVAIFCQVWPAKPLYKLAINGFGFRPGSGFGLFFVKNDFHLCVKYLTLAIPHLPPHHLANMTLTFSRALHFRLPPFPQKPGYKRRRTLIHQVQRTDSPPGKRTFGLRQCLSSTPSCP